MNFLNWNETIILQFLAVYGIILSIKFLDTADVIERWRSTEAVLLQVVSRNIQVANGRQLSSSLGLRT